MTNTCRGKKGLSSVHWLRGLLMVLVAEYNTRMFERKERNADPTGNPRDRHGDREGLGAWVIYPEMQAGPISARLGDPENQHKVVNLCDRRHVARLW